MPRALDATRALPGRRALRRRSLCACTIAAGLHLALPTERLHADWAHWRGPEQAGISRETAYPETFSRDGENVLWKAPTGGRSTPIVMSNRVYLVNRAGQGATEQERVICLDAETGRVHWEHRFSVFLTDIASSRVGWASPCGDPETGNVYVHGIQGTFLCLDIDGNVVWRRSLHEEFGAVSGHAGRTNTPIVDGDLVIISFINASWGAFAGGAHRFVAFDKLTGQVVWWSQAGEAYHGSTCSTPVVAVVNGVRLLVTGAADGAVYGLKVRTGETVWTFKLSERGLNASVVVCEDKVYACHGDENLDSAAIGRIVCIDATGSGDVTGTHERWRLDGVTAGFSSPLVADGRLYVFDRSANLFAIDGDTGKLFWRHSVGTVMRASPVWVDGKIYCGEVNGRFVILKPGDAGCKTVCEVTWPTADGTIIEVNGSAAAANGRLYFATGDELYCLGYRSWGGSKGPVPAAPVETAAAADAPAHLQVVPADVVLQPGQGAVFTARLFNAGGQLLRAEKASWLLKGAVTGSVSGTGKLTVAPEAGFGAGALEARIGSLAGEARLRVVPAVPFKIDFEALEEGKPIPGWIGSGFQLTPAVVAGEKVLRKAPGDPRFSDAEGFFGLPTWGGYTVQADVHGTEARGQLASFALYNCGYQLILMGNQQRLRIAGWTARPRLEAVKPFAWKPGVWYTLKLRCAVKADRGIVQAKAWRRDEGEPQEWTLEVEDPAPCATGSPGVHAYSAGATSRSPGAEAYFDNIEITNNE